MNIFKKKAMLTTTALLGFGGYILYQNIKTRLDNLEEEVWSMDEEELEMCPYCERVYTIEDDERNVCLEIEEHVNGNKEDCNYIQE